MQTIPQAPVDRNPRRVDDRRAHQCARPGWRPRRRTRRQLARDVAASIRQQRAAGDTRWTQPSEFTLDAETQNLVCQLLTANTAAQQ
jgi:hypothetical protein